MSAERYYEFDAGYETDVTPTPSDPSDAADLVNLAYAEGHFARGVADLTALAAIVAARRTTNLPVYVTAEKSWFYFDSASSATADAKTVVAPSAGTGRWFRRNPNSSFTLTNNQSSAANVTGLIFDKTVIRGALIWVTIYREHTSKISMSGLISVDTDGTNWSIGSGGWSNFAGVDFTITSSGQVQYTTTDMAGALVAEEMKWKILEIMGVA